MHNYKFSKNSKFSFLNQLQLCSPESTGLLFSDLLILIIGISVEHYLATITVSVK